MKDKKNVVINEPIVIVKEVVIIRGDDNYVSINFIKVEIYVVIRVIFLMYLVQGSNFLVAKKVLTEKISYRVMNEVIIAVYIIDYRDCK